MKRLALILLLLIGSNVLTGYLTVQFSDDLWQEHIEKVSGPAYREAGFIEGYYKANFDTCLELRGQADHYECSGIVARLYDEQYHKRHWNWRRVKGNGYN